MPDLSPRIPVEIENYSGFDLSFENFFTTKVGTLTPALCKELIPGDKVSLSVSSQIQLPPMATDFYGTVNGIFEAFFVPYRVLWAGWKDYIARKFEYYNSALSASREAFGTTYMYPEYIPTVNIYVLLSSSTQIDLLNERFGAGSLSDYLGFYVFGESQSGILNSVNVSISAFPFLAYHKIWNDWYRNSRTTREIFLPVTSLNAATSSLVAATGQLSALPFLSNWITVDGSGFTSLGPYVSGTSSASFSEETPSSSSSTMAPYFVDGTSLFDLRQRCFRKDYFTNAEPLPQGGVAESVQIADDAFTISQLRAANSLQRFKERNNYAGPEYGDFIKAHFGLRPADATTGRCLYLGRQVVNVYNKSIYQNSGTSTESQNPFSTIATKYASSQGVGSGSLISKGKFTASEHGLLFVMFSLVPSPVYSSGVDRKFYHTDFADFAFPMLAGIGDQPIYKAELCGDVTNYSGSTTQESEEFLDTFGYTQRYAEYKISHNEVHGLLRDGQSLDAFALQRSFESLDDVGEISTAFQEIPTDYMDNVSAVNGSVSQFGCWVDSFFSFKKSSRLPEFSLPTLEDTTTHKHTEFISNGGTNLNG